jgi:alpha-galactosidase
MRDAGYQYVVIDDCWQGDRDKAGNITADPAKFPSGIKALADYVHSKGLKFGIYTDAGTKTCAGRPGSLGHEYQDAQQYADWGVDYLKEDWCSTLPGQDTKSSYALMRNALAATGRPIVFSICEWGSTQPWLWATPIGNLWRATGDIQDCWDCKRDWGGLGFTRILDQVSEIGSFAGPGHWNDLDMLEVGNGGMTTEEYRVHFSMWAMLSAPLIAGNDLKNMSADTREILLNKDAIAIDQDRLGIPARRVKSESDTEVWSKQLADGSRAVALVNRGTTPKTMSVSWEDLGYPVVPLRLQAD